MKQIGLALNSLLIVSVCIGLSSAICGQTPPKAKVMRGKLTANDPKDRLFKKSPHVVHVLTFNKDKYYLVDLTSDNFDPILRLEDSFGNQIAWNDGGTRDARLSFGLNMTAKLRLIVTADPRGKVTGAYRLTVRSVTEKERKQLATAQTVINLNAKVLKLLRQARLKEALAQARRALEQGRTVKVISPRVYDSALDNLAVLSVRLGKYKEALPLFRQLQEFRKETRNRGSDDAVNANLLRNIAVVYAKLGEYEKSLPYFRHALRVFGKKYGQRSRHYADVLDSLAYVYRNTGEYDKAWSHAEQSMQIRKAIDPTHIDYADSLSHLSILYVASGQYQKALQFSREAVQVLEKKLGGKDPRLAPALTNLALAHMHLGRYDKALQLEQRAAEIHKSVNENHPLHSKSLEIMAYLYSQLRQNDKALRLHQQAADILRKVYDRDHPDYIRCSSQLALQYGVSDRPAHALRLARELAENAKKSHGERHPKYARCLEVLAVVHRYAGRPSKALPLLLQAQRIRKKTDSATLGALGKVYLELGRISDALPILHKTAAMVKEERGRQNPLYAQEVRMLSHAHWGLGNYAESAKLLSECLNVLRLSHDRSSSVLTYGQRLQLAEAGKRALNDYLIVAQSAKMNASDLYEQLLHWKGNVLARQAEERAILDRAELQPLVEKIWVLRANLAKLYQSKPSSPEQNKSWKKHFEQTEQELTEAEKQLAGKSQSFQRYQRLRTAATKDVRRSVAKKTAFVEFAFYSHWQPISKDKRFWSKEKRLLAFVFRHDSDSVMIELGAARPIVDLVSRWRKAVTNEKSGSKIEPIGNDLRKRIWQPLEKHLRDIRTVIIAADGVLCRFPFAALPGRKSKYLLEEQRIGYVTSGQHFLQYRSFPASKKGRGLLAFGDIDYGGAKLLPALPATKLEVSHARDLYKRTFGDDGQAAIFSGATVTKQAFSEHFLPGKTKKRWRYLHLATHGEFEAPKPLPLPQKLWKLLGINSAKDAQTYIKHPMLRCNLAFANAGNDRANGILTGKEISAMDMRGVDLAVLSACESGLGRVDEGEGVLGLQQAFHMAGCRTVVAGLWSLDDAATAVLVKEFYQNIWKKKMSKLEALRQAQLTLLRNPKLHRNRTLALYRQMRRPVGNRRVPGARDVDRSHPAFWAGLVLSGDPGE